MKETKRHTYDDRTMVCRCGKTFEQHINIKLLAEKWRDRNFNGETNL